MPHVVMGPLCARVAGRGTRRARSDLAASPASCTPAARPYSARRRCPSSPSGGSGARPDNTGRASLGESRGSAKRRSASCPRTRSRRAEPRVGAPDQHDVQPRRQVLDEDRQRVGRRHRCARRGRRRRPARSAATRSTPGCRAGRGPRSRSVTREELRRAASVDDGASCSTAASRPNHSSVTSSSNSSSDSQALGMEVVPTQLDSSCDFPDPAGATTRVSGLATTSSSRSLRRARGTK